MHGGEFNAQQPLLAHDLRARERRLEWPLLDPQRRWALVLRRVACQGHEAIEAFARRLRPGHGIPELRRDLFELTAGPCRIEVLAISLQLMLEEGEMCMAVTQLLLEEGEDVFCCDVM